MRSHFDIYGMQPYSSLPPPTPQAHSVHTYVRHAALGLGHHVDELLQPVQAGVVEGRQALIPIPPLHMLRLCLCLHMLL